MLADVLHIRGLGKKLVDLVADVQLLIRLEVSSSQLLLDSREYLQGPGVLGFASFVGNALLGIENTAFEDRWPALAGVVAGLDALFQVQACLC